MNENDNFKIVKSDVFRHEKFGYLRVITDDQGENWFVGKVVAEAMGYSQPTEALRDHVDFADSKVLIYKAFAKMEKASDLWRGNDYSNKTLINESGLYSLVLGSKLQQARVFKHWVTSEVLPQIRKTGGYIPAQEGEDELMIMSRAFAICQRTIDEQKKQIVDMSQKVQYLDDVVASVDCMTTSQVAKELDMTAIELNKLLCKHGIQYGQSGQYLLYADYARRGFAKNRTFQHTDKDGLSHTRTSLVWTERGREFIHRLVKWGTLT